MTLSITVEGMTCSLCEESVEEALQGVPGVVDATADRDAERASVDGDADVAALLQAVEDVGFTPHT